MCCDKSHFEKVGNLMKKYTTTFLFLSCVLRFSLFISSKNYNNWSRNRIFLLNELKKQMENTHAQIVVQVNCVNQILHYSYYSGLAWHGMICTHFWLVYASITPAARCLTVIVRSNRTVISWILYRDVVFFVVVALFIYSFRFAHRNAMHNDRMTDIFELAVQYSRTA